MGKLSVLDRGEREHFILEFLIIKNNKITIGEAIKELQDYENRKGKYLIKRV
jgi:hypothetical protein